MKQKESTNSLFVNQVKITFTQKSITAWGGIASIIAKFLEQIHFREWVEESIPIEERSNNAKGIYAKVLAQFLTALVGGERFSHLSWWGHGVEILEQTFGVEWLPKASTTLTRFWKKVNSHAVAEKMGDTARGLARTVVEWAGIREDTLRLDSTVITRYGSQEGAKRGYNPKKRGRPSHHPILAFLGSGYIVNLWNRSGNAFSAHRAKEFFTQTITALGEKFRVLKVLCDSGFYEIGFIEYLEKEGYNYIISAPLYRVIQNEIYRVMNWQQIAYGIEVGEFFFEHLDRKWKVPRRYVVIRQEIKKRPKASGKQLSLFKELEELKEYRFSVMITNDQTSASEDIWYGYRPRANDENKLKDIKEGYGFDTFNLHGFWATEAVMLMNGLVFHNLIHYLNSTVINSNVSREQMKTLRGKYLTLPAMLGSSGRYALLRLGVKDRSLRAKIISILSRILLIPHKLNCIAVDT